MASDPESLRVYLANRDEPCPGCGYNLRGLESRACPECREPLELNVRLAEPNIGRWLATLIGLCVGAGTAGSAILLAIGLSLHFGDWPPAGLFLIPGLALTIEGSLALLILRQDVRQWFRRSLIAGRLAALLAWCATGAFLVGLLIYITEV